MDNESADPVLEIPLIPGKLRRTLTFETSAGPYFTLVLSGLKESELFEIRDLLVSRGWIAG